MSDMGIIIILDEYHKIKSMLFLFDFLHVMLNVCNNAINYYAFTYDVFRSFPFELKRVASQQIASADSVHRNTCPVK